MQTVIYDGRAAYSGMTEAFHNAIFIDSALPVLSNKIKMHILSSGYHYLIICWEMKNLLEVPASKRTSRAPLSSAFCLGAHFALKCANLSKQIE